MASAAHIGSTPPAQRSVIDGITLFYFPIFYGAAIVLVFAARGVAVPMEPELSQVAKSRRYGILLVCTAIGYTGTFSMIARVEPDAWVAAAFGLIPFAIGVGYFVDSMLVKRDLEAHS